MTGTAPSLPDDVAAHLRELVDRHMVVFERRPAYVIGPDGKRDDVGYDMELAGTHSEAVLEGREAHPFPGCERCVAVYDDLVQIARAVLPASDRPSRYEIRGFRPALSYDRKRRPNPRVDRPDVTLTIEIRHRQDFFAPVDPCEDRCVHDIVAGLRALGVQEDTWSPIKARLFHQDLQAHPDRA